jgi:head-tail adaptor
MTIHAGRLHARLSVTAQQTVELPNGGQDTVDVAVMVNAPAELVPIGSDERIRQGTQYATATHRAHVRMPRDLAGQVIAVTPAMTASATHGYTGEVRAFRIVEVVDVEGRGRELELVLEERVT